MVSLLLRKVIDVAYKIRIGFLWFHFYFSCLNKWLRQNTSFWMIQPLFIPLLHLFFQFCLRLKEYSHLFITRTHLVSSSALILPNNHFVSKLRLSFHCWGIIAAIISWEKKRTFNFRGYTLMWCTVLYWGSTLCWSGCFCTYCTDLICMQSFGDVYNKASKFVCQNEQKTI